MKPLHSLLKRQLRRFPDQTIPLLEETPGFLHAVNDAYWQADTDRKMLEHSLELTSQELLEKNAELRRVNSELERRVVERTAELSRNEARFRGLFEHVPVSILEEDFSAVRQYIDSLRKDGIVDFSAYFDMHPQAVAESAALVKIVDVNHATLEMYQAANKAELLAELSNVLGPESLDPFKNELLTLIQGDLLFETELINYTLRGERLTVFLSLTVAPGYEQTWAKAFVVLSNVTERRKAESALVAERDLLQILMDNIPDMIYFKDTSSRFTRINRAQAKLLGIPEPEAAIGKTDLDFQAPVLAQSFYAEEQELVRTGTSLISRIDFNPNSDGQPRWFSATKVPIKDETGIVTGIVGISRDITQRKLAEDALSQSEERFKLIAWATKDAVWDWDLRANQIWWGDGLQKIFSYSSDLIQPDPAWRLARIHPEDRQKVNHAIDQALQLGMEFWSKEYRFQRKDGRYADIMDRGYILRDEHGQPYRMIGAMLDITERKYMESTLLQANDQMRQVLNELQLRNHETALLNKMSRLLQACQSAEDAYKVITEFTSQIFPQTSGAIYLLNATRTLATVMSSWGDAVSMNRAFIPSDCISLRRGTTHPLNQDTTGARCLHLAEPFPTVSLCLPIQVQSEVLGVLHLESQEEQYVDQSKTQIAFVIVEQTAMALSNLRLREALREQSIRDPLTELYNRRYMEESLKQHLSRVTRHLHPLGIIMIDIDNFKYFNDTYGHAVGDELLREIGQFLKKSVRNEDTACRYGGEEFILIMPEVSLEKVQQRAEDLRRGVKQLLVRESLFHDPISLSIGIAMYPTHGQTIEGILKSADSALYQAKQEGRDRVVLAAAK